MHPIYWEGSTIYSFSLILRVYCFLKNVNVHSCHLLFDHFQFTLINGPNFLKWSMTSLSGPVVKNPPAMQGTQVQSLIWEDSTRKQGSFLGCSVVKILPVMQETHLETGLILGLGRSHGGRHGNLLQYSCLEKLMDRGARRATVQGVKESDMTEALEHSWTSLSRFLCNIVLYSIRLYFHHQSHPQLDVLSTLTQALLSFWSYFSTLLR